MKQIYLAILLTTVASIAFADMALVGNFKGFYTGPLVAYGKGRVGVNNQRYKKTRLMAGVLAGYGHVFQEKGLYLGNEWALVSDTFSEKKEGQRLEKTGHLETLVRFGEIIENNFLPYAAVGGFYGRYKLKSDALNRKFHMSGWIGEVGVDAFVRPNITIRSSIRYQRGLRVYGGKDQVRVQKKPQEVLLKIGISYIFN